MLVMRKFEGTDADAAREFALQWLPAWSGNDPECLLSFYAEDAYYSDPAVPDGICGKEDLRTYFERLLARNPDWIWAQLDAVPMRKGFLNKWKATIPTSQGIETICGVCTVEFDRDQLIANNEVYFDRSSLSASEQRRSRHNG